MSNSVNIYRLTPACKEPLTFVIATKSSNSKDLSWFDEKADVRRDIRYAENQKSIFVDEQDGQARLSHVIFERGGLQVPVNRPALVKFLAHHPDNVANGGHYFYLIDHQKEVAAQTEQLDHSFEAQRISRSLDLKALEAVMRKINPIQVSKMSSEELKRDVRLFAVNNPDKFMEYANSEVAVKENTVATFFEAGILKMKGDRVYWNLPNNKKMLIELEPGDEDQYGSVFKFLQSDDGLESLKILNNMLKEA